MADRNSQAPEEHMGPTTRPAEQPKGPGEAILLGALASGVNKPTWTTLKIVLLGLGASLLLLLHVCRSSPELSQHVVVLIVITGTLFVLLKWFVAQRGLVSVQDQMVELRLIDPPQRSEKRKDPQGHVD